jgi:hypothetical protein
VAVPPTLTPCGTAFGAAPGPAEGPGSCSRCGLRNRRRSSVGTGGTEAKPRRGALTNHRCDVNCDNASQRLPMQSFRPLLALPICVTVEAGLGESTGSISSKMR